MSPASIIAGRVYVDPSNPFRWLVAVDSRELCATFVDATTLVYCGLGADACAQLAEVSYGEERDQALAKVVAHLWRPATPTPSVAVLEIAQALLSSYEEANAEVARAHAKASASNAAMTVDPATQRAATDALCDHAKACGVSQGLGRAIEIVQPHVAPRAESARRTA